MENQWGLGFHLIFMISFFVASTNTCLAAPNRTVGCSGKEGLALLKFKHSLTNDFKMLSSWVGNDCCRWEGVRCDDASGSVVSLHLRGNAWEYSVDEASYLVGDEVHSSLAELRHLKYLDLSGNDFKGSRIPQFIGSLKQLTYLNLSASNFGGLGTIPGSIGQLTQMYTLDISRNSLEGVVSEAYVGNLSMLKYLDTSYNSELTFNISHEWIPPFQLRSVWLSSCKIAGEFPKWFRTQRNLKKLVLSNASISGPLPTWLRKMPIISLLDLSHNQLSGPLTNIPFGDPFLQLLLQNNLFNGSIPRSLCRSRRLTILDVSRNKLSGKIPPCLDNLQYLRAMILSSNRLSGVIPSTLAHISSSLSWLNLNDNNFTGELPRSLAKLASLRVLDLGDNKFSGNIPKWIGDKLTTLIVLRLHKNNFTGRIPPSLCKNSYLHILDVAHNSLKGSIPHCFRELNGMIDGIHEYLCNGSSDSDRNVIQVMKGVVLEYTTTLELVINMDLSSNKLEGEIPEGLTALSMLVGLNLSHNQLSGGIPDKIGNMKSLISLDLSGNHLSGLIPPGMATMTFLSKLDLSHNNLSGRIPTGNQLQTLIDPSIYDGNVNLCGSPLPKNCSGDKEPTKKKGNEKYKADDEPSKVWFYLDIMCGFATGFWGIIGLLLFKKTCREKLFTSVEVTMDMIHVEIIVRVAKMKIEREGT